MLYLQFSGWDYFSFVSETVLIKCYYNILKKLCCFWTNWELCYQMCSNRQLLILCTVPFVTFICFSMYSHIDVNIFSFIELVMEMLWFYVCFYSNIQLIRKPCFLFQSDPSRPYLISSMELFLVDYIGRREVSSQPISTVHIT